MFEFDLRSSLTVEKNLVDVKRRNVAGTVFDPTQSFFNRILRRKTFERRLGTHQRLGHSTRGKFASVHETDAPSRGRYLCTLVIPVRISLQYWSALSCSAYAPRPVDKPARKLRRSSSMERRRPAARSRNWTVRCWPTVN